MPLRRAVVAGQFYPADPAVLRKEIALYFQAAARRFPDAAPQKAPSGSEAAQAGSEAASSPWSDARPLLTMLPHAGYMFCGHVMAAALAGVELPPRLIILAPSHTGMGHPLGYWPSGSWETPLGPVSVDADLGRELAALDGGDGGFAPDTAPHLREHDIEVLLPFLQTVQPGCFILPIVVGRPEGLAEAAHALARLIQSHMKDGRADVGIIVSSDMNHYAEDKENRRRDALALDAFLALDAQTLLDVVRQNAISMCGILPALVGLLAARELGAARARLAAYDTSAAASGDTRRVVGYAGVRVW